MTETSASLAITLRDEMSSLADLLSAIDSQTSAPPEIVVVDGGSRDGTFEALEEWARKRPPVLVLSKPGANIAQGRNFAIQHCTREVIAVTDGGCRPEPDWFGKITAVFADPATDVAMGFYRADTRNLFQMLVSCLNLPDSDEVRSDRFMPSSRSIAFRRSAWDRAGRYPEWLEVGEDMYLNKEMLRAGAHRVFVPDAIVRWKLRSDLRGFLRQYFRYAQGDGIAGMYPRRHALRFAAYLGSTALIVASFRWPALLVLPGVGALWWMLVPYRRMLRRLRSRRISGFLILPVLEIMMDAAKMAGYLAGRFHRGGVRVTA